MRVRSAMRQDLSFIHKKTKPQTVGHVHRKTVEVHTE